MRACLLIVCLAVYGTCCSQPYFTGKRTIVFNDPSRSNRSVNTDVCYPAASAGLNAPLASGTEKFPVVVFGHGFVMPTGAYT